MSATKQEIAVKQETKGTVADYLATLVWDGSPRLDRWLVDCAGADDTDHVRLVSRRVLVAAVRRVRKPGCRFDQLPVFEGPQGSGKSTALRVLAVVDAWFTEAAPVCSADVRWIIEVTTGKWIVEVSALEEASRSEAASLKAFLSRTHDEARMAFARETSRVPRSFVVVGTTYETEGYCHDATGNRRFVPVRVRRFDLEKLRAERDQLWAEAAVLEARGEPIDLVPAG